MSFVEDARKLLQDFVASELHGINQRLDDLVAGLEKSFAEVERLAQELQQASEKLTSERQNTLLDRMEALKRELLMAVDLAIAHRRIEELEGRLRQPGTGSVSGSTPA